MSKIFTHDLDKLTRYALIQPCCVHPDLSIVPNQSLIGLLDTGATRTFIGREIVQQMELFSNEFEITYGNTGESYSKIYRKLRIRLPNFPQGFLVDAVCTGAHYGETLPFNFIIGMDIIKRGNFSIDSETKKFTLDFSKTKI